MAMINPLRYCSCAGNGGGYYYSAQRLSLLWRRCSSSFSSCWASSSHPERAWRTGLSRVGRKKMMTSSTATTTSIMADRCNLNIVSSPFPPIPPGPYPPFYEFVASNWKPHGGYLDDKVAIVDGSTGLQRTFRDYYRYTGALAYTLWHEMQVNEGTTVAMYCGNHVDFVPVILAVSLCGAKLTPVNPLYTSMELDDVLDRTRSSVLFVHHTKLSVALESAKRSKYLKHIIVITDHPTGGSSGGTTVPEGTVDIHALWHDHSRALHHTHHKVHPQTHSHALMLPYSSGTTGFPKGVCLTHENLVVNLLQLEELEKLAFPPDHKLISPLPFFHIYAFTVSLMYTAWKGQTLITTSARFDLESFCQLVQQHRPERANLVPPILLGLAKHPVVDQYDMSSLRMIMSAAAPLSSNIEAEVKARLGCDVKQGWGLSELSPIATINSDFAIKPGSVGPLISSTVGKIVDEHGHSLGPNQDGELLIKGPQVMMGYLDDPDKTAECKSPSGWLRTGDVGRYDNDGYFYITDRIKELIKVRGFQVAPAELEALLVTHPAVHDAAVISIPDETAGELPRAYVARKPSAEAQQLTEQELKDWVKARVASYKRLEGGVEFIPSIPRSASGKILRRVLRDHVIGATEDRK